MMNPLTFFIGFVIGVIVVPVMVQIYKLIRLITGKHKDPMLVFLLSVIGVLSMFIATMYLLKGLSA